MVPILQDAQTIATLLSSLAIFIVALGIAWLLFQLGRVIPKLPGE